MTACIALLIEERKTIVLCIDLRANGINTLAE